MSTQQPFQRQAIRAAVRIHQHLCTPHVPARYITLPQPQWEEVSTLMRRLHVVQSHAWRAASLTVAGDLEYQLRRLAAEIDSLRGRLPPANPPSKLASAGVIAADLSALAEEFEAVEIDLKEKLIKVDTEPIVLEDTHLGAFRIVLHWERIGAGRAYDAVALEPNCPAGREDVTHPHVEDHQLCEGAGAPAIRTALASGRLLDFFVLVRQLLQTYNGSSAYVTLSDWSGTEDVTCTDCGCFMSSDEACTCERCDVRVCNDCQTSCRECGRYICCECCGACSKCSNNFCQTCLNEVAGSQRLICDGCLFKEEYASDDEQDEQPTTEADAVCVGEAAVPA
jgi:hypothetical protein